MEDLFVKKKFRERGIGTILINRLIKKAEELNCYKIIGQSRFEREPVHEWYEKNGFKKHGWNFRMDLQWSKNY